MPTILPVSNMWLIVLLVVGGSLNFAIKTKMVNDVNRHLPPERHWRRFQYMTFLHGIWLEKDHRRFYPKSKLRLLSAVATILFLPILLEFAARWL